MKPAPDLRTAVFQLFEQLSKRNLTDFENMLSPEEAVLAIGTDAKEWWAGRETVLKQFKSELASPGDVQIIPEKVNAYREGSVGWADCQTILQLDPTVRVPMRVTLVLNIENGKWKLLQWHASVGVPNENLPQFSLPV